MFKLKVKVINWLKEKKEELEVLQPELMAKVDELRVKKVLEKAYVRLNTGSDEFRVNEASLGLEKYCMIDILQGNLYEYTRELGIQASVDDYWFIFTKLDESEED